MSSVLGTVSEGLTYVCCDEKCAGFGAFRPSCMCCVSVVRCVVVECLALKPS